MSYEHKHNEVNGEDNRDGTDENYGRNWGVEGETESQPIRRMRERMKRNLLATLMFSQGVRMLSHGDEMGRTQRGNNNAYCQDNEISWANWDLDSSDRSLLEFTRECLRIFRSNPVLRRRSFFRGRPLAGDGVKDLTWLQPDGREMQDRDWGDQENRILGMLVHGRATDEVDERGRPVYGETLLLLLNGGWRSRVFTLPRVERPGTWEEMLNTARAGTRLVRKPTVNLIAHSVILLRYTEPA